MQDARSPAAAHQQDFLLLPAAEARREASGQQETERGRRGDGADKARGRGEARGRPAGADPGRGRCHSARLSPAPQAPRARGLDATAAQRRRAPTPSTLSTSSLAPPPAWCASPHGACAEPSTSCYGGGGLGAGTGSGEAKPMKREAEVREVCWGPF